MIIINNITKTFPNIGNRHNAIDRISASIKPGESIGIIGKSGAGKSTLLRCINALERPEKGAIEIQGHNVLTASSAQLKTIRQKIGFIFQHYHLLSSKTVFENIALPLQLQAFKKEAIKKSVHQMIKQVDLQAHANHYPSQLSGGQKQRVAIARALINNPTILLCDEFNSALDSKTSSDIQQLLKKIQAKNDITLVFISHDLNLIQHLSQRVWVIEKGQLIEDQNTSEFFKHPRTTVAKELLQEHRKSYSNTRNHDFEKRKKPETNKVFIEVKLTEPVNIPQLIDQVSHTHQVPLKLVEPPDKAFKRPSVDSFIIKTEGNNEEISNILRCFKNNKCLPQIKECV
jgi:D-methionine transport system ATP-binding protein